MKRINTLRLMIRLWFVLAAAASTSLSAQNVPLISSPFPKKQDPWFKAGYLVWRSRFPPRRTSPSIVEKATKAIQQRSSRTSNDAQASRQTDLQSKRSLTFAESMVCGAISRSISRTFLYPADTMKTILQTSRAGPDAPTIATLIRPSNWARLWRGWGAIFWLSIPNGAVTFAVTEYTREKLGQGVQSSSLLGQNDKKKLEPGLDFLSSSVSTIACSVVSAPQMMIVTNIEAGNYPSLSTAVVGLARGRGLKGFYAGCWPMLVSRIPSYALTWTFYKQLQKSRDRLSNRPALDIENSFMGCLASAAAVTVMIPLDTIKTRLVAQMGSVGSEQAYNGIVDCATRMLCEEGVSVFYKGLVPRLVCVVPLVGIQFGVYEFMKRIMLQQRRLDAP